MCAMKRKTLVVCKPCHDAIHSGQSTYSIRKAVAGKE
jgi:hypothetical protein